jgi:DHA1 family bicyclomycin/chloramphenicol resistance-like MFS transporter
MESQAFGVVWGIMAVAYVIGATLGAKLTERIGSAVLLRMSVGLSVLAATILVVLTGPEPVPIAALLIPVFLLMMFSGTTTPGAMAGAIRPHPDMAGTASGLSSACGLVLSGSFTVITGLLYAGAFQPVAALMLAATVLAAGGMLLAAKAQDPSSGTG